MKITAFRNDIILLNRQIIKNDSVIEFEFFWSANEFESQLHVLQSFPVLN